MAVTPTPAAGQLVLASWGVAVTSWLNNADLPWTAYTPTISGTGWALGNGSIVGAYRAIGARTIHARGKFVAGSTSAFGSGQLAMALPVAVNGASRHVGHAFFINSIVGTAFCVASGATVIFYGLTGTQGGLTSLVQNSNGTFVAGSTVEFNIRYESA